VGFAVSVAIIAFHDFGGYLTKHIFGIAFRKAEVGRKTLRFAHLSRKIVCQNMLPGVELSFGLWVRVIPQLLTAIQRPVLP